MIVKGWQENEKMSVEVMVLQKFERVHLNGRMD